MKVEFKGLDELIMALQQVGDNVEKSKKEALEEGAKVLQKGARSLARRKTGNLIKYIEISDVDNDEINVFVDQQGKAYYGYFLEFGTSKMPAYPFMGPAFMREKNNIESAMANSLRRRIEMMS